MEQYCKLSYVLLSLILLLTLMGCHQSPANSQEAPVWQTGSNGERFRISTFAKEGLNYSKVKVVSILPIGIKRPKLDLTPEASRTLLRWIEQQPCKVTDLKTVEKDPYKSNIPAAFFLMDDRTSWELRRGIIVGENGEIRMRMDNELFEKILDLVQAHKNNDQVEKEICQLILDLQ